MTPRTVSTRTGFKNNAIAIEAGLQASEYGKTPAEIMYANDLSPADRFWFNAQVRAATAEFKERKQEEARDAQSSAGAASPQEQREMHDRQNDRANARESMQEAGMNAPSPDGQLSQLQELQEQEAQAESIFDGDADPSGPGESPDSGGDQ